MRLIAVITALLGILVVVFGVVFIFQAASSEDIIAAEISPVKIADVNATYDAVKAKLAPLAAAEEPNIQAGKAAPSTTYVYLSGQRTALGLAKANIGVAGFVRTMGILEIVIGLGMVLAAFATYRRSSRITQHLPH